MGLDNIIICFIILVIVAFQIFFIFNTYNKISLYKNIFVQRIFLRYNEECHITDGDLQCDSIPIICSVTGISSTFQQIIDNLNAYLLKNSGQIADYHLMKDIVDRNCGTKEEEINTQIPFPLYLGLMGTMLGILVGVGFLVFGGGLTQLLDATMVVDSAENGIIQLLSGVALAMISSVFGIFFTTLASYLQKDAKCKMELQKNEFLEWIQEELLPQLSTDMSSALVRMTRQLTNFNKSFAQNTKEMRETLLMVNDASKWQAQLLQTIENLKIDRIASANIAVYDKLQNCTEEIDKLGVYLKNTEGYLMQVQLLNNKLGEADERNKTIERLGQFFESEINAIRERKALLNESVSDIDNNLRKAISELKESAKLEILRLNESFGEQTKLFKTAMVEQSQEIARQMEELNASYPKIVQEREESIDKLVNNMSDAIDEFKKIRQQDDRDRMDELISLVGRLYDKVGESSQQSIMVDCPEVKVKAQMPISRFYKVTALVCSILIALYCFVELVHLILDLLNGYNWL